MVTLFYLLDVSSEEGRSKVPVEEERKEKVPVPINKRKKEYSIVPDERKEGSIMDLVTNKGCLILKFTLFGLFPVMSVVCQTG